MVMVIMAMLAGVVLAGLLTIKVYNKDRYRFMLQLDQQGHEMPLSINVCTYCERQCSFLHTPSLGLSWSGSGLACWLEWSWLGCRLSRSSETTIRIQNKSRKVIYWCGQLYVWWSVVCVHVVVSK